MDPGDAGGMPRRTKPPRLWLRKERALADGKRQSAWYIVDQRRYIPTGCAPGEISAAGKKLAEYIAEQHQPARREAELDQINVADVLSIYVDDCGAYQANQKRFLARLSRLAAFWGERTLAEVTGVTCRRYALERGNAGGARRDLEDLRAAINHHSKEGFHRGSVGVVLPPKGAARERWLTREEAARLLWVCWRARETQFGTPTEKRPLRHLARFILIGLYTGTRAGAIATASSERCDGRSFVDLERGIFYRLAAGRRATKKRQPPVPIPARLLVHLRRWALIDAKARQAGEPGRTHFVEWQGKAVASVKTGFASAVRQAGLGKGVSPHTLRHTAATWLMQAGVPLWEAAGFLGMSEKMLRDVYGHHHPDHQRGAAEAIGYGRRQRGPALISLSEQRTKRAV